MSAASARGARPRKVMIVVPSMGLGGAERQAFLLLDSLDPEAWAGSLLALDSGGYFYDQAREAGHSTSCLGIKSKLPLGGLLRLRRQIRLDRPDVVLLRGFSATTLGRLAIIGLNPRPAVVIAEHATGRAANRTILHDVVDRVLLGLTDAFVGVAHGQMDYLVSEKHLPADKVRIILNGVDFGPYLAGDRAESRERLGLPTAAFVVGIVAALRPEKDHVTFLQAASLLAKQTDDCVFLVVGNGPLRTQIEALIEKSGLSSRVLMLGARTDVECILPALDVFTLSSDTETLPMAVLEAMGSAVAVVATMVGGLPEMVEDGVTGLLVPPSNPERLADAWRRLHDDRMLALTMGRNGRDRALRKFTSQEMARAYEKFFDGLVSKGGTCRD